MQEKLTLAEQIQNSVLLNYGGMIDKHFMKMMNEISEEMRRIEDWNAKLVNCCTAVINRVEMVGVITSSDPEFQDLVNASDEVTF